MERMMGPLPYILLLAVIIFAGAGPALAQTPQPSDDYQSAIATLADRLAADLPHLTSADKKHPAAPPKILVADFPNRRNQWNILGQQFADALSDALQSRLGPAAILPRAQFQQRMRAAGIALDDLRNDKTLQWQATQLGVTHVLTGRLARNDDLTNLDLTLTSIAAPSQHATASAILSLPADMEKLVHEPLDWPPDPAAPIVCPATTDNHDHSVTIPKCILCAPPSYTDAARKAHWQGNLLLKLSINDQGLVTSAVTLAGAPYGVDDQALATLRTWQFQPATRDGQPIPTCVSVEVTLRFY
jgi:TonB family protein